MIFYAAAIGRRLQWLQQSASDRLQFFYLSMIASNVSMNASLAMIDRLAHLRAQLHNGTNDRWGPNAENLQRR